MKVEIDLQATEAHGRSFIGWTPVKATVRLSEADVRLGTTNISLRNGGAPGGGRVMLGLKRSDAGASELALSLPADGSPVEFWVAGEFQHPSIAPDDACIKAVVPAGVVGRRDLMVRIRKNAVTLTSAERDRFLLALGKLNDAGAGLFQSFRDTHIADALDEAHGFPGFPPWHRAYLLDLERSLQAIDPAVALPYWRFDEPAANLFAPEFLGMPSADTAQGDIIQFPHGHALEFWKTDPTHDPIERRPVFDIAVPPPQTSAGRPFVIDQAATLALGAGRYSGFRLMEGAPHGAAHTSFSGPISNPATAAKDPLFFLLHANVDRLWALWQWFNRRADPTDPDTYSLSGPVRPPDDIGHKLDDTMWPWNGSTTWPRPTSPPPRGAFPPSPSTASPGTQPRIRDMIDYQGIHGTEALGFDYDDVPFELHP